MSALTHAQVQEGAAFFAALPAADPERLAAFAHAHDCAGCARSLAQGVRLQLALGLVEEPAPSPLLLARVSAEILAELDAEEARAAAAAPARQPLLLWVVAPLSVAAGFLLLVLLHKHPLALSALSESISIAVAAAAIAALALSDLRRCAAAAAVLTSAALVFANAGPGPLAESIGALCLRAELITAAFALGATAAAAVYTRMRASPLFYAGITAAGALAGQAALDMSCPARAAGGHLIVFHFGGVLLAALIGALVSRAPALRTA